MSEQKPFGEQPKKPEFGEYAPESEIKQPAEATTVAGPQLGADPAPQSVPTRLAGVPHNLGVSGSAGQPQNVSAPQTPPPYTQAPPPGDPAQPEFSKVAPGQESAGQKETSGQYGQQSTEQLSAVPTAPSQANQSNQPQQFPAAPKPTSLNEMNAPKNRRGDRIATIILLVIGALGALNLALAARELPFQIYLIVDSLGMDDLVLPPVIKTVATVTAITVLSIYAVSLLFSFHRLRNKKLAFWVPLTAGAIALIVLFIGVTVAFAFVPELLENLTPENMDAIFSSLLEQQQ